MVWKKEYLDLILVPTGLLIMLCYHLFLLYRCLRHPETTVIGNENHCRNAWVERMLQIEAKDRGQSLAVISSTITAANFLASTSLALSSLIGTWVLNSSNSITSFTYGDTSPAMNSIKYVSILACFLLALASFLHCIRSFIHATFLISMPHSDTPLSDVQKAVIHGGLFWTLGLRAIYFATNLLLWVFGPIPMFVCSVTMVLILNKLDSNSTPLHQFQPARSHDNRLMGKLAEEKTQIHRVIEQHERSHIDDSKTQGSNCQQSPASSKDFSEATG
ncbi:uncharacterized protein LOC133728087 [Rosa rugosa]|uniref:uncharacterized protein LOC133728087 n=1 Tax=Rosa rugosa TaxID=74645 RepID=UPI002B400898|nr:uncharacterized protein LOC133728087 [Rosa rugosa]